MSCTYLFESVNNSDGFNIRYPKTLQKPEFVVFQSAVENVVVVSHLIQNYLIYRWCSSRHDLLYLGVPGSIGLGDQSGHSTRIYGGQLDR